MEKNKSNLEIKNDRVILSINPKIYSLETVYSAAYVFLDRTYVLLDGDPETEIVVELKPKQEENLEKLGREFNNELINYADYLKRAARTKKMREMILQRVMVTNDPSLAKKSDMGFDEELEKLSEKTEEDFDYIEDPEGIAVPWEEKYEKKRE